MFNETLSQLTSSCSALERKIESLVRKAVYDFSLLPKDGRIGIALSGGKDSITLLLMLLKLSGRGFGKLDIQAFHVQGVASCGAGLATSALSAICKKLNVPLHILDSQIKEDQLHCYRCSRERRSLIFNAAKAQDIDFIAFGHHKDDQIQTLLLNLLHKAEFATSLPKIRMVDYGITIVRPLLYVDESSIVTWSKQKGFARVTCMCPVGQHSNRRKVQEIIEMLKQTFPNCKTNLFQAAMRYGSNKAIRESL
ncbi:tRNA 2-thiocytidine(32) synthetase TtcA [Candidatus Aerophobetes bacterium]|uniref:tRNA 2-thiocytidine(32) synthetase TtcA n=1 Tax=Aerophobetes bacterium TaxID=2030807 RepID=A0A2A4X7F6_UNCAE|nr:MAG: tRNA 2-thiocytidine(32) synthetase TtcA [Candidatus Aerophobetes bacterium]